MDTEHENCHLLLKRPMFLRTAEPRSKKENINEMIATYCVGSLR
jgi:hypothetical protein